MPSYGFDDPSIVGWINAKQIHGSTCERFDKKVRE